MFGFDDDDGLDGFDHFDFGEVRDHTGFITPDDEHNQNHPPHATSPSPPHTFSFSSTQTNKSLSPASTSPTNFTQIFPSNPPFSESGQSNSQSPSGVSSPSPAVSYRKSKWTQAEDESLMESVRIHGTRNWTAVSALVPGRNPKQCRERYTAQLAPGLTKDEWTAAEDDILLRYHSTCGNAWAKIATFLPGRAPNAVKNRYNWLSRRHLPQTMASIYAQQPVQMNPYGMQTVIGVPIRMAPMQQMPMQIRPQAQMGMQVPQAMPYNMPRYNSLSPVQCCNFGLSDPAFEFPPPRRQAQSATGSFTENADEWEGFDAQIQTEQSAINELCDDYDFLS